MNLRALALVGHIVFVTSSAQANDAQLLAQCECYIKATIAAPLSYSKIKSSVAPAPITLGDKARIDVLFEELTSSGATEKGYGICIAFNSGAGVTTLTIDGQEVRHDLAYAEATWDCDKIGN